MANKEINIYSVSFLDLLSGALAAVLILFIVIPKMSQENIRAIEELERLDVEYAQLAELIEAARNSVPTDLYEQIQQQMEQMETTISDLRNEVENLQRRVTELEEENLQLREQMENMRQQMENAQQQHSADQQRIAELERQLREAKKRQDGLPSNLPDKGEVEVFIIWGENVDVDLYVQNMDNSEICQHPGITNQTGEERPNIKSWGILDMDINNQRLGMEGSKYYELFYQRTPVPGRYKIYFNIFDDARANTRWDGRPATVKGFIVMFPGKDNEQRIDFGPVTLRAAMQNHIVGILNVTENNITLQQ